MAITNGLPHGVDALRDSMALPQVMAAVEATARWVAPETFELLPVWYPEYARGMQLTSAGWSQLRVRADGTPARETNVQASKALTAALGLTPAGRRGWSCCHVWGVDDPRFASRNAIVRDHRFYSCVGNMVLIPDPMKAFTDCVPEVKAMLRLCARNLYGRACGGEEDGTTAVAALADDPAWPASWPRAPGEGRPTGTIPLSDGIRRRAERRRAEIRSDLDTAGPLYPRERVQLAFAEFGVAL